MRELQKSRSLAETLSLKILYAVNGERGEGKGREGRGREGEGKKNAEAEGDFASANPLSMQQRRKRKNEARRGKEIE